MPSTPTTPTAAVNSGVNPTSLASGAFTPPANALLLACVTMRRTSTGATVSGLSGHGTWNPVSGLAVEYGGAFIQSLWFWCVAGGSPSSEAVTASFGVSPSRANLQLMQIASDFDSVTPVRQSKNIGTASTVSSLSGDFDSAPLSASMLVSGAAGGDGTPRTPSAASGWTQLASFVPNTLHVNVQYRTGTTATDFGGVWSGTCSEGIAISALEIQAPAAGSSPLNKIIMFHGG